MNQNLTIVQIGIEGNVDDEKPPLVYKGHLTIEEAEKIAKDYGGAYPVCNVVKCYDHEEPGRPSQSIEQSVRNTFIISPKIER